MALDAVGATEMAQLRDEFPGTRFGEIVEMFMEEGREELRRLAAGVEQRNAPQVRRAAHALKGSCANFGARPLEALCDRIERDARRENLTTAVRLLARTAEEYRRLEMALNEECQTGGAR